MSEFFKQLLAQFSAIWSRLSLQQKIIITSIVAFTLFGMVTLMVWSSDGNSDSGYKVLYRRVSVDDASEITAKLQEGGYNYKLEDDGSTILVEKKKLYEARMALAREGLPKSSGVGYELFDKTNIGMSDFVQKLNARRALEGELVRTIQGLDEVDFVRIHIVIPEQTIFLEDKKAPKASVVIKTKPHAELSKDKIRGITYLVSSAVDGLKPANISIVDFEGRLLSNPYGDDAAALASSRNIELQQNVERMLENKVNKMLTGVLGPNKVSVQISADLDFNQVESTLEKYDPESKVVRSEERNDENTKNAPDGDHQSERSLTNYEIDKTVEHIIREVGNINRLTVAVAVDGRYEKGEGKNGEDKYVPRTSEEIMNIESMVKNAVGYDLARGDQITVANVRFDNEFLRKEQAAMENSERMQLYMMIVKYVAVFVLGIMLILFLRYIASTVAEAMNPPVPAISPMGPVEEEPVEVPEPMRKTNEILERVEMMTREEPLNIASIIRQWLSQ